MENEWINQIYEAAQAQFSNDPDIHHEVVTNRMVTAALTALAEIAQEHASADCARFVRSVTV